MLNIKLWCWKEFRNKSERYRVDFWFSRTEMRIADHSGVLCVGEERWKNAKFSNDGFRAQAPQPPPTNASPTHPLIHGSPDYTRVHRTHVWSLAHTHWCMHGLTHMYAHTQTHAWSWRACSNPLTQQIQQTKHPPGRHTKHAHAQIQTHRVNPLQLPIQTPLAKPGYPTERSDGKDLDMAPLCVCACLHLSSRTKR